MCVLTLLPNDITIKKLSTNTDPHRLIYFAGCNYTYMGVTILTYTDEEQGGY